MAKITDFLQTKRPLEELRLALEILREFKACESQEEWLVIPFSAWAKLEQYEEFLAHLIEETPLRDDTLLYIKEEVMSSGQLTFTIRIEQTHDCGQLHEYVIHMKKDESFSYTLTTEVGAVIPEIDVLAGFPNFIGSVYRPKLSLVGHYERVVISGIEMKEHQVRCLGCGEDLLFSDGENT